MPTVFRQTVLEQREAVKMQLISHSADTVEENKHIQLLKEISDTLNRIENEFKKP